jgi:hypothetical protein
MEQLAKQKHFAGYLHAAVISFPDQIGTDSAIIWCSGDKAAYDETTSWVFHALGPAGMSYLDEDPTAACFMTVAALKIYHGF